MKKGTQPMKKCFVLLLLLSMSCLALPVQAATQTDIDAAVAKGVAWLAAQQNPDGSWGAYYYVGHTGFAVLKLETHAIQTGWDPLDPSYEYSGNVSAGLDYLFSMATNVPIGVQPAGDPDTNGNGLGTYFASDVTHAIYETSIAMMALAASTHPEMIVNVPGSVVDGHTYFDVLQDAVDYLAYAQNDGGSERGGWGYQANMIGWSDNSISSWATLALSYAEANQIEGDTGFGCTVPSFVRTELNLWVDYIQNDVNGDTNDGGSGYTAPNDWVNILKTGSLLFQMAFLGDTAETPRVMDAVDYIERHWNDPNVDPGWRGPPPHYQAMYNVMKGLDAHGIAIINNGTDVDWFNEMADAILAQQLPDGSWPFDYWGDSSLSTAWALLFLQRVTSLPPPGPVGGFILSDDALALLAPFLVAATAVTATATVILKKRRT